MNEFINNHTIKIQLGILLSFLVAGASIFIYIGVFMNQVEALTDKIEYHDAQVQKVPILENNILTIKDDMKEMKTDIKTLLKQR